MKYNDICITKENYQDLIKELDRHIAEDCVQDGVYCGSYYQGSLCFDVIIREPDKGKMSIDIDCYVLGVDTGYGYTKKNGIPYDYHGGTSLDGDLFKFYKHAMFQSEIDQHFSYDDFLCEVQKEALDYIKNNHDLNKYAYCKLGNWE